MDSRSLISLTQRIGERRYGIVPRRHLLQNDVPAWWIDRRVAEKTLVAVYPGIYRLGGVRPDFRGRLLAATDWAAPEGLASYRACAWLFRLDGAKKVLDITGTGRRNRIPTGVRYRRTGDLPPCDRTKVGIVPCTSVTRMLIEIGHVVDEETLEVMLDQSLREGRTSIARLRNRLEQLGRPGRPGVASMRRLLSDRDPAAAPTESFLETRCNRLFRRAGLPRVQPQLVVYDDGGYVGRIDFDYPDDDLVIEAHSYKYHSSWRAFETDVDRWNRLRAMGKRLVLITWRDAQDLPDKVVADIRRELAKPTGLFGHHYPP